MFERLRPSLLALALLPGCALAFDVPFASQAPIIDGNPSDAAWQKSDWIEMDQLMVGTLPGPADFRGRYKLVWTPEHLYLLAEITDDILMDSHPDPLDSYWEDDALEIFLDEDASGGAHQFTYNAFAYHISLDNQAVDIGPFLSEMDAQAGTVNFRTYPEHIQSRWKRAAEQPHRIYWEVQLSVYGDNYLDAVPDGQDAALPVSLEAGKTLGFMLAYCDSDSPAGREHFMGDVLIEPLNGDRNLGYLDAGVFGRITLVD